jgi:hypothetical protein
MFLCPPVICRQAELQKAGRPAFCLRRQTPATRILAKALLTSNVPKIFGTLPKRNWICFARRKLMVDHHFACVPRRLPPLNKPVPLP